LIGSQVVFRSAGPKLRHFSDEIAAIDLTPVKKYQAMKKVIKV
jgi:hypothetical protein